MKMDKLKDSLGDSLIFSTLRLQREKWLLKIEIEDIEESQTAFTLYHGLYQITWRPFG